MDVGVIQDALRQRGIGGWLFYDFNHRDPIAYRVLGLDENSHTSRRWFYLIPADGEPQKLSHMVEPGKLDPIPGKQRFYRAWTELHAELKSMLSSVGTVAMQYSPMNNIPYVANVDAGTIELVRSSGVEVVSSAELVQLFEAVMDEHGFRKHAEAGRLVQGIKDEAFARMDRALRDSTPVRECEIRDFIVSRFEAEGLTNDGHGPIVGFNEHPADPHFEPTEENSHTLHHSDTILIDLWARHREPVGVYYDVTWCGFAGSDPPAQYKEIFSVVCRARDAALELVQRRFAAGDALQGWEVDRATRRVVEEAGYGDDFVHRTGHNIGREVHGNGANIDDLETRDDRPLVPGTCFSIEPGIYLKERMAVRTEIDVFLTPAGNVEVCGAIQQELILIG
jgi:Xaa-Pro dipeptidase